MALRNELYDKSVAEQSTGCVQRGKLEIYNDSGKDITYKQAIKEIRKEKSIEIPSAGAGNYREVFCEILGFKDLKVIEWSSSAGDWSFGVKDLNGWRVCWQNNRYPHYGFRYEISEEHWGYTTFEDLMVCMEQDSR